jgi:hypothetical protein
MRFTKPADGQGLGIDDRVDIRRPGLAAIAGRAAWADLENRGSPARDRRRRSVQATGRHGGVLHHFHENTACADDEHEAKARIAP